MRPHKMKSSKRRATVKKKGARTKLAAFSTFALACLMILVAISAYRVYSLLSARPASETPIFEIYPSTSIEAAVERADRGMCDALLALKVKADDVEFKSVKRKRDGDKEWTFSEMEIFVSRSTRRRSIEEAFSEALSHLTPKTSIRFASSPQGEKVLDVAVDGRPTHRLIFKKQRDRDEVLRHPRPLVAIIIDDLGYDEQMANKFLELSAPLSFSIIPHSPFQKSIAAAVHRSGRDVLLHLPMEPLEYPSVDPGGGVLLTAMGPDELVDQLRKDLEVVPFVVGVNSHMGSKLTQDSARIRQIFTVLKKRDLFFVDSYTNLNSVCAEVAELLQLRFARRHVFLDHAQEPNAIRFQLKRLMTVAKSQGRAIGIAHPHPATWEVLKQELPIIQDEVRLIRISELVG
jgi:polysaccharide deacetylase 2 family uncharacterized protein YibQ